MRCFFRRGSSGGLRPADVLHDAGRLSLARTITLLSVYRSYILLCCRKRNFHVLSRKISLFWAASFSGLQLLAPSAPRHRFQVFVSRGRRRDHSNYSAQNFGTETKVSAARCMSSGQIASKFIPKQSFSDDLVLFHFRRRTRRDSNRTVAIFSQRVKGRFPLFTSPLTSSSRPFLTVKNEGVDIAKITYVTTPPT